jgi:hypothetical protein
VLAKRKAMVYFISEILVDYGSYAVELFLTSGFGLGEVRVPSRSSDVYHTCEGYAWAVKYETNFYFTNDSSHYVFFVPGHLK